MTRSSNPLLTQPRRHGHLLAAGLIALILTVVIRLARDVVVEQSCRLDGVSLSDIKAGTAVYGILGRLTLNLLFKGPIPYSILGVFLACGVYYLLLLALRVLPNARAARRDTAILERELTAGREDPEDAMVRTIGKLPTRSFLRERLQQLLAAHEGNKSRLQTHDENDRLAALADTNAYYFLQPLSHGEWMLPVLGFVGTVWGVILAVSDLREGITTLFRDRDVTEAALKSFTGGFDGLGVAFFTTLFGLVGLALVGTANFLLRRGTGRALLTIDDHCRAVIHQLPEPDLADLLRKGMFVTDELGQVQHDSDGKPQLRIADWLKDMRQGLFVLDEDGAIRRGADGAPVQRTESFRELLRKGLFVTDEKGELVVGDDHKPIPRWQRYLDSSEVFRRQLLTVMVREFLEVTDDQVERIVDGLIHDEHGEEQEVWLRSKAERRFRQLIGELRFMEAQIEHTGGPSAGDGEEAGVPALGHRILPPVGAPVDCVAVDGARFGVARETGPNQNEFVVHLGRIEERVNGNYLVPFLDEEYPISIPEQPHGLALGTDRIAVSFEASNSVETYGLSSSTPSNEQVFEEGKLLGRSLVLVQRDSVPHAVIALRGKKDSVLHCWRLDGAAPSGHTEESGRFVGKTSALAGWSQRAFAAASHSGKGTQLTVLNASELLQEALRGTVAALAFTPTGSLCYLTPEGVLFEFDLRRQDPASKERNRLRIGGAFDRLQVTAADQVVLARMGGNDVWFAPFEGAGEPVRLRYQSPVSCLATSADGACTIVGLADGSAWFHDTRRPVVGS